jgi:hypothetical protein
MEEIYIDVAESIWGAQIGKRKLRVHDREHCVGPNCCIHNPSDHPLSSAPLNWRADRQIMERFCECGIGHPDPDDLWYRVNIQGEDPKYAGVHGCCGHCRSIIEE